MVRLLTIPAKTVMVLLVSLLMVGTVPTAGFADVTSLEVDPATGVYRGTVDLTATISPAVEGLSISFSLAGNPVDTALTNASGVATINNAALGTIAADTYAAGVSAEFDGDGTYDPSDDTAQLQVTKRDVTGSFTSPNRPYDGTTDADANNLQLSNDAGGAVSLVGGTATFATPGVGDNKVVTLSGATLDGTEADNYHLDSVGTATADITQRGLTVVATAQDKPYDGNRTATVTLDDNRIAGDALTVDYTSALFDTKEVGTNKTVTVSGIAITGGADAGNYNLLNTSDTDQASITNAIELTVTFTANDKVYDATTAVTGSSYELHGVNPGDSVSLTGGTKSFSSAAVGLRTATWSGFSLSGPDAGNYTLASTQATDTATISERQVTASFTADNKVYDATMAATIDTRNLSNAVDPLADVTVSGGSVTFSTENVGSHTVTWTGFSLSGPKASNYNLTNASATDTANITQRGLTVVATAQDKPYDGNRTATVTLDDNRIAGDALTLSYTSALFDTKEVGTNKTVTVTGIAITGGADAGNYNLLNTSDTDQASITNAIELTVTFTANDKVYDATTAVTGSSYDLNGVNPGDSVSLTGGTKSFSSAAVGLRTATWSGFSLSGPDAGNYTLASTQATDTATISERQVTASFTAFNKVYDGTTAATIDTRNLGNAVAGDDVNVSGGSVTFATADVGSHTVTWTGFSLNGTNASNYNLTNASATDTANITPKPLTVSFTAADKTYDTTTAADMSSPTLDGVISPDVVTVTGGTATFSSKNVGIDKTVTGTGFSLGGDAGNYSIGTVATTTATISPAAVTGSFTAASKIYDSTLTAAITSRQITGGVLGGETVTLTGGTATFDTENVGTAKTVTGTGFTLGGSGAGNYALGAVATTTANVTPRAVTGSFTVQTREYDGTTLATVAGTTLSGVISGDAVSLSVAGATFATKDVGTNKTVTPGTAGLIGTSAPNYALATVPNATASITQRLLTVDIPAVPTKRYDGTANAMGHVTLVGDPVEGDDAAPTYASASFASHEIGVHEVTVNGIGITGTTGGNYMLESTTATAQGEILPKNGIFVDFTAESRTYNGTRRALLASTPTIVGVTPSDADDVGVEGNGLSFNNRWAGRGKTVTWNGLELTGSAASRYVLATLPPTDSAAIFRRLLSVRARGEDKVWDGTTRARVSLYARNKVSGDSLRLAYDNAEFGGPAVGRDKTITVTGIRVGGEDAANYRWNTRTKTTADIIKLVKRYRSDGLIKQAGRRYMGNDTYNITADRQTKEVNARRGQKRVFYVKVQNENVRHARRQPLRLEGCFPTRGFKVNYYRGRSSTQIGDYAIVDGDLTWVYRTPRLRPGRGFLVRMVLRPTSFAKIASQSGCAITAYSTRIGTDRTQPTVDMVRARLTVVRSR